MTIQLPQTPSGYDYEDFVAVWLAACGYYTETRMILRKDSNDVLELDVVASPPDRPNEGRILVDAKSSSSGFSDLFKVYGWRKYLQIPRGSIVQQKAIDPNRKTALDEVARQTDVSIVQVTEEQLEPSGCFCRWWNTNDDAFTFKSVIKKGLHVEDRAGGIPTMMPSPSSP